MCSNGYTSLHVYILSAQKCMHIRSVLFFFASKKDRCPTWAVTWAHLALFQVALRYYHISAYSVGESWYYFTFDS